MDKIEESLNYIVKNKAIKTVFQPIVSLKSGDILGYEALSRITCESDIENTEMLFEVAGKYNRLWDLELICRTKALESAYKFMVPPYNKKLFMNVNPNTMHDDAFKKGFTREFLRQYKIAPHNVIFEITERNVIDDMDGFKSTVSHYKSQEYKIAIDDAGAGYSGLNLISDVNPNFIKLDMKLIRNINEDNLKGALVMGMVEFSQASNVRLIAEGIETYEELETIIKLGVQYGQGYFIKQPDEDINGVNQNVIQDILDINVNVSQQSECNMRNSPIKCLCDNTATISPQGSVIKVYEKIKEDPNSFGLTIVEDGTPIGIITKEKLALSLSGQYGFTLYQNKPISVIMDKEFLSVDCETPVNVVSSLAMARPNGKLYDFIVVTEGNKYAGTVTIKKLLEKSNELELIAAKQQNPLSGLPGNMAIEETLSEIIAKDEKYSVAYIDIDNFKAYNDVYGFESGDSVITLLADVLRQYIPVGQFIGHVGGDDFVVVLNDHVDEDYFSDIIATFEEDVLSFYNDKDLEKGFIITENRRGKIEEFPLITLTAVVISNESDDYKSPFEISATLARLKLKAKKAKR